MTGKKKLRYLEHIGEEVAVVAMSFLLTTVLGPLCALFSIKKLCPENVYL